MAARPGVHALCTEARTVPPAVSIPVTSAADHTTAAVRRARRELAFTVASPRMPPYLRRFLQGSAAAGDRKSTDSPTFRANPHPPAAQPSDRYTPLPP